MYVEQRFNQSKQVPVVILLSDIFYGSFIFNIEIKIEYLSREYTDPHINSIYYLHVYMYTLSHINTDTYTIHTHARARTHTHTHIHLSMDVCFLIGNDSKLVLKT